MVWLTVLVFVFLLLALVLAHEWGHFIMARRAGCRVEEFAFGFPPRLFSIKRGETTYTFNLLPLGGYVKIEGENMDDEKPGPYSFAAKSAGWRVTILAAGVMMNMVLAVALLSIQAGIGSPTLVTEENQNRVVDLQTFIVGIGAASPAAEAGLMEFDRIVLLDGIDQPSIEQVQALVAGKAGRAISMTVERQGRRLDFSLIPRLDPPANEGALGVVLQATGLEKVAWWQAPWEGFKRTGRMLAAIAGQFGLIISRLASGGGVGETLTGPVGIALLTNEVTKLGISYILEFGALISVNLAIINILPIPALDGGRILFVVIEAIFGRRVPGKIEYFSHMTGFALLILLMILITLKDVRQFF